MADPPAPAPGWYPDPDQVQTQRYWDGENWTEQTAPIGPGPASTLPASSLPANTLPLALALLGAGVAGIAIFLPQVESEGLARVSENTLIQSGDGILILIAALVGAIAAFMGRDRPGLTWIAVLAGVAIIGLAIYNGTGDRLHLTGGATDSPDLETALNAIVGEQGSPGVGIFAAGIGGALLAVGGFWLGRGARQRSAP